MNRWVRLAFVVVAAAVVAQVVVWDAGRQPATPSAAEDVEAKVAPEAPELALPALDGHEIDLRSLRGRVVVVNFWASWCGPCQAELPRLVELWQARRDRCFEVLAVAAMSPRGDVEARARELPFPVLWDERAHALGDWSVPAFPWTFVIDARGRVRRVFKAPVEEGELAQTVDRLLPAACPGRNG